MVPRRDRLVLLSFALLVAAWMVAETLTGMQTGLLYLAPALVLALPLILGRYVGEEQLAGLAGRARTPPAPARVADRRPEELRAGDAAGRPAGRVRDGQAPAAGGRALPYRRLTIPLNLSRRTSHDPQHPYCAPRRRRGDRRRRRHRARRQQRSDNTKSSGPVTVTVKDAKPVGGVKDVTFKSGGTVDLTVKSDTADEVHFHGYDVHKDVPAGGSVHFKFPAKIDGKFIVELENHKVTLANVTVEP